MASHGGTIAWAKPYLSVTGLKQLNGLTDSSLRVGQVLTVSVATVRRHATLT